ncbi:hypothetical protein [Foetidibacter luteolus]|uniref:hypothetical protein n=1 Tax=Foetidibacter luteolus TaxID=2608880 RepID=UPI00129B8093|nr:hypothetical protein [Foetidibacter luteolus]
MAVHLQDAEKPFFGHRHLVFMASPVVSLTAPFGTFFNKAKVGNLIAAIRLFASRAETLHI